MKAVWGLIGSLLFALPGYAHEPREGDIHGTVGPYLHKTVTGYRGDKQTPYLGLGIIAEGDVDYNGGVEIAIFYLDKLYVRRGENGTQAEHIKRMHITSGYRHWVTSWFSGGLSIYSAYSMGDPVVLEGDSPPADEDATTARKVTEHGLDWSFQLEVWRHEEMAALVDLRFHDALTAKRDERADAWGVLVGFKSYIPKPVKKKPEAKP
jgi:hypothetical protein